MKMEAMSSTISFGDDNRRDLEQLLEAFGSTVSLEDIASAYCQAGRNVYTTAEILCTQQGSTSSSSTSTCKDDMQSVNASSEQSSDCMLEKSDYVERKSVASKLKKSSASMGTVSGVIGRDYAKLRAPTNHSYKAKKPLKVTSDEFPPSEIWGEEYPPARDETLHKDMEDFLFAMLGDGFHLNMNIIRDVLGVCGYDLRKSLDKLLNLSASVLGKSDDILGTATENAMMNCPDLEASTCRGKLRQMVSVECDEARSEATNSLELSKRGKDKNDLQREVLEALFSVPDRFEEAPKSPQRQVLRSRASRKVVVEPLKATTIGRRVVSAKPHALECEDEENEGSYTVLRRAVKEYWITMKEYYKAAGDAFAKGDHARAEKFLEEGHFYMEKAQEADEKSMQKLLETRNDEDDMSIDLHDHEPKEAIRLLRVHLTTLSGISSVLYLKLIVAITDEDSKVKARKRLIMKFLEKESIKWTEEDDGRIIAIRVDEINPERLSFAKRA